MLEPVVFQVSYPPYNAGETAGVPVHVAERLLASGRAVRPGEPMKLLLPQPAQGSRPEPAQCMACGEQFMPDGVNPHRCASAPPAGSEVFEAGFHQGRSGGGWRARRGR